MYVFVRSVLRGQDFCKNYALRFSMLDETGFYAPSMAHNTLPCLPWQGISVFHGIILTEI
ncbi:hypothetical protein K410107C12_23350 [Agathobacter rectalis]